MLHGLLSIHAISNSANILSKRGLILLCFNDSIWILKEFTDEISQHDVATLSSYESNSSRKLFDILRKLRSIWRSTDCTSWVSITREDLWNKSNLMQVAKHRLRLLLTRNNELWTLSIRAYVTKEEPLACKFLWPALILITVVRLAIRPGENDDTARVAFPSRRHHMLIEPVVVCFEKSLTLRLLLCCYSRCIAPVKTSDILTIVIHATLLTPWIEPVDWEWAACPSYLCILWWTVGEVLSTDHGWPTSRRRDENTCWWIRLSLLDEFSSMCLRDWYSYDLLLESFQRAWQNSP